MGPEQFGLHAELEERHWWFAARRQIVRDLVRRVHPPANGGTIVDVGCGTGANIAAFEGEYRAVGVDPSAEGIAHARKRFPGVRFVHGYAPQDLGDIAAEADIFLLMDVLEHVPDDKHLLGSILSAAKPGAHVLITVPADKSLWSDHDVAFGHYRRYDRELLRSAWSDFPVTVRLLTHYNARLFLPVKVVRTVGRWRGRGFGRAGTDLSSPRPSMNRLLRTIFAGESKRVLSCLDAEHDAGYRFGVSLIALLRRQPGDVSIPEPTGPNS